MKKTFLYTVASLSFSMTYSQGGIDSVLAQISKNNPAIKTNLAYWSAQKEQYRTGLTPYDPQVEYDYLFGSPAGAGNQEDFSITQRLDFPTAYKRKKELSNQQVAQTSLQQQVYRQDILLEAKLLTLQVIYLNKKSTEFNLRLINTQKLVQDYQKKLDKGDVIILDVNKAKLQLLNIKNETALNENEKQILLTKISELNGGIPIAINDSIYPFVPLIPDFEILDSTIEANDPIIKVY